MKKILGKLLVAMLLVATMLSCVACGERIPDEQTTDGKFSGKNPFVLKVWNFDGGYGSEWLRSLEKQYEEIWLTKGPFTVDGKQYDSVDVRIESVKKVMDEMAVNWNSSNHIYFHEAVYYQNYLRTNNIFEDMTEALTTENPYEPGVTLESKLSDEQKEYYNVNGKYYGIPHYAGYVGITYNRDIFDSRIGYYLRKDYTYDGNTANLSDCFTNDDALKSDGPDGVHGTDDDGLPTTYDEFFMLCGFLEQSDIVPITWTDKNASAYLNWFISSLAASYEGLEQMDLNHSFNGTATDLISVDNNGVVSNLEATEITKDNGYELARQAGKYYGLSFMEKIIANDKWYKSDTYSSHTDAQDLFIQGDATTNEVAMLIDGVWWENEASSTFNTLEQQGMGGKKDHNYAWMPLPCATEEKAVERAEKLRNGEKGYTLLETHNSLCFIGKGISADARKIAIDFIQFANTNKALLEFTKFTDTTKALIYTIPEESKNELSTFGRSLLSMQEKANISYTYSKEIFYQNNEMTFSDYDRIFDSSVNGSMETIPIYAFQKGITAKQYFDGLYYYQKNTLWNTLAK